MLSYPTVSIVTINYNCAHYLPDAIQSVVSQDYSMLEYIIVDGGSNDSSLSIIKDFHARYPDLIKFISEPDNGIYDAMNKGISLSSGDLIGILNSDDILKPSSIQHLVDNLLACNFPFDKPAYSTSPVELISTDGSVIGISSPYLIKCVTRDVIARCRHLISESLLLPPLQSVWSLQHEIQIEF